MDWNLCLVLDFALYLLIWAFCWFVSLVLLVLICLFVYAVFSGFDIVFSLRILNGLWVLHCGFVVLGCAFGVLWLFELVCVWVLFCCLCLA